MVIEELLSNQWTVGITVGVISGLILFPVTKFINTKLSKKDYYKNVNFANDEVKNYLINSVSEGHHPQVNLINTLRMSISRKYNVEESDLLSLNEILEDLIRIIFNTNFISIDKKIKSSDILLEMMKDEKLGIETEIEKEKSYNIRSGFVVTMVSTVGILMLSMAVSIILSKEPSANIDIEPNKMFQLTMVTFSSFTLVVAVITLVRRLLSSKKLEQEIKSQIYDLRK
ncbi:hypothetical protein VBD025_00870 [Virgibacillus flavescens]|uniref:hypothetical protein n=1 Tax=Virgibacillus flavescens TaxID=1611422 RepID=UPI003D33C6B1